MSNGNYKDCPKCQEPVHRNSKACRSCGCASPWAKSEAMQESATAPNTLTMADVELAKTTLANQPDPKPALDLIVDGPGEMAVAASFVDRTSRLELDLSPSDSEVAAFMASQPDHDALAREKQADIDRAMTGPHVFMEKFSCMIGPVMGHFKPGQVVIDFPLLMVLKNENAPMVPVSEAPGMACCPQCLHVFNLAKVVPARRAG